MYVLKETYFRGSLETRGNICPLIVKIWPLKFSCFSQHQILFRVWNLCLWQLCQLWARRQSLIRAQRLARMTTQTQLKLLSLRFTTVLANKKYKGYARGECVCKKQLLVLSKCLLETGVNFVVEWYIPRRMKN